MFKSATDYFFSELTKFKVVDNEGNNLGRVGDVLLNSEDISIDSLILFGSILEEKMEDIGLREDIDPIVSVAVLLTGAVMFYITYFKKRKLKS